MTLIMVGSCLQGISVQSLWHHWKLLSTSIFHDILFLWMLVLWHSIFGVWWQMHCLGWRVWYIMVTDYLVVGHVHVFIIVILGRIQYWTELGCRVWYIMVTDYYINGSMDVYYIIMVVSRVIQCSWFYAVNESHDNHNSDHNRIRNWHPILHFLTYVLN